MHVHFWSAIENYTWCNLHNKNQQCALLIYQGQQRHKWHNCITSPRVFDLLLINGDVLCEVLDNVLLQMCLDRLDLITVVCSFSCLEMLHLLSVVILHSIHLYFTLIRFSMFKFTSYHFSQSFTLHSVLVWYLFHLLMMWLMWLASCLPVFT